MLLIGALIVGIALFVIPHTEVVLQTFQENKEYFYASTSMGTSMYPTIKQGDTLLIMEKEHPDFTINVGDILVYERNGTAIAHRVVGRYMCCGFFVKGDNSQIIETIYYDQVIGKVVEIRH
jgi:signal peptidase I